MLRVATVNIYYNSSKIVNMNIQLRTINKPAIGSHPDWAPVYIDKLPADGQVLQHLQNGLEQIKALVAELSEEQLLYRYEVDKWTIKETLVHLMDAERVFTFRGLTAARRDGQPLPGFDHNAYVPNSEANDRDIADIMGEYEALRRATVRFFNALSDDALGFIGEAKDQPCSAQAMVYMIAGHERHHMQIIRERYL